MASKKLTKSRPQSPRPLKKAADRPRTQKAAVSRAPAAKAVLKPRAGGVAARASSEKDRWRAEDVQEAFARFAAAKPEPRGELEYINPFTLLVAVVLSAQATDAGVNKATRQLFALVRTPQEMVDLGEERLRETIKTIGLYRAKARNVIKLSAQLIANHGGDVPRTRADLEALLGVGRKTANVVLNIAFAEPTIAVDTHVFRVGNRTGLAPGATPLDVERELERAIPAEFKLHAHHWLILHGRYVCTARAPKCDRCLIADLCRWPEKRI
jgi:endonuclease-3